MTASNNSYWLYGKHAVLAALNNPNRKIHTILATDSTAKEVKQALGARQVKISTAQQIDASMKSTTSAHQGIAAFVEPLTTRSLNDFIKKIASKKKSVVIALDQVTDPQNAGAIIRSCVAFGADGVIVTKHNSFPENGLLAKASCGTIENIDLITVANLSNSFEELKEQGFWVIGMDGDGKEEISKIREYDKLVIVLGAEGAGIRRLTKENCDLITRINISDNAESLNVSVATAIALYEFNR